MAIEPVYLHSNLYPKYLAEIAALASEGYNIILTDRICFEPETSTKLEPVLPKVVEFARPTHYWIDEAPNVGTIGRTPEPQLSFLSKSMRIHFTTKQDDTYVQNA